MEGRVKYQKRKEEFVALSQRFSAIIKAKVEDDSERPTTLSSPEPAPSQQIDYNKSTGVSYSHLEE